MDHDQLMYIAGGIAFVSMVAGLLLRFVLIAALEAIFAPGAPAPPPTPPSPKSFSAASTADPTAQAGSAAPAAPANETPHDKAIRERIAQKSPFVQDGGEYLQRGRARGQKRFHERLLEAGVTEIYVDMQAGGPLTPKIYIELPDDPAGRAACFTAYTNYCQDAAAPVDPAEEKDTGQKYMVIQLKR